MNIEQRRKLGKFLLIVGLSCAVYAGASIGLGIIAEVITTSPAHFGEAMIPAPSHTRDGIPADEWIQWARWFTIWGLILGVLSVGMLCAARDLRP